MNNKLKCLAVAFPALALTPASAFTLANPGFESGPLVDDGSGVGKWLPFNNGGTNMTLLSTANPRSGQQSLRLELGSPNGFAGVFQDVPVLAGGEVIFAGWNSLASGVTGGSEVRIEFLDSVANAEVSVTSNLIPSFSSATYEEFSLSATVPAGADTARLVYAIQSFGAGVPQVVDVDDITVSGSAVIPEPSASMMALLGLLGVALRRRR